LEEIEKKEEVVLRFRHGFQLEITKPSLFDGNLEKVVGFVMTYKFYIKIRIRMESVEEKVH